VTTPRKIVVSAAAEAAPGAERNVHSPQPHRVTTRFLLPSVRPRP
jgi:hypothetical protein